MANVPIAITVDTTSGNMTVNPTVTNCHQGDLVIWSLTNGMNPLTISFKDGTPCDAQQKSGTGSVEGGILPDATKGVYHYNVAAQVGSTIYVTPGCPEIIVG